MTSRIPLWTVAILSIAALVRAVDDPRVTWHYPTGKPTYLLSDVLNISYTTPYTDPRVGLWCTKVGESVEGRFRERNGSPGTGWTLFALDAIPSPVSSCFFIVWEDQLNGDHWDADKTAGHGQNSVDFDVQFIRQAAVTSGLLSLPASVSTSSSTTSAATSSLTTSATTSTGSPTDQPQSTGPQAPSLGTGAIAGIAIGVAALSLVLGGLAVVFWRRWRTKAALGKSGAMSKEEWPELRRCRCRDWEFWSLDKKHAGFAPRELSDSGNHRPHELS